MQNLLETAQSADTTEWSVSLGILAEKRPHCQSNRPGLLQVQDQLQSEMVVESFAAGDGGTESITLADVLNDRVPGMANARDYKLIAVKPHFCVSLPGQSEWLQQSSGLTPSCSSAGTVPVCSVQQCSHSRLCCSFCLALLLASTAS